MNEWNLRRAVLALRAGGIVAHATEAVFGLACDPFDEVAVMRVLDVKGRSMTQGLILIAHDFEQVAALVNLEAAAFARVDTRRLGPTTWVMPATSKVPPWIRGAHRTIAVRVTVHPQAASLCRFFGAPLVSTSANRSGQRPARDALTVRLRLSSGAIDYILPGEVGGARGPSEIRDAITDRVIRAAT